MYLDYQEHLKREDDINIKWHSSTIMEICNPYGISDPGELTSTFLVSVDIASCENQPALASRVPVTLSQWWCQHTGGILEIYTSHCSRLGLLSFNHEIIKS